MIQKHYNSILRKGFLVEDRCTVEIFKAQDLQKLSSLPAISRSDLLWPNNVVEFCLWSVKYTSSWTCLVHCCPASRLHEAASSSPPEPPEIAKTFIHKRSCLRNWTAPAAGDTWVATVNISQSGAGQQKALDTPELDDTSNEYWKSAKHR